MEQLYSRHKFNVRLHNKLEVYANDTDGNMAESSIYNYTTTAEVPISSSIGTNNTNVGQSTNFMHIGRILTD